MIQLTIDDKPIEVHEGRTILEACREHGVHIPTLCYHPALEPYGACRLCMVEVSQNGPGAPGRLCVYPCEEGVIVKTDTPWVQEVGASPPSFYWQDHPIHLRSLHSQTNWV
jgi:NADH dehydrogenase/NADH:ubiquinone oxidoreductase subunit G